MTRVNLVDVKTLMDQHLVAEYCEIPMVLSSLERSIKARGVENIYKIVPKRYTLNRGHVSFFYDKLKWLEGRYRAVFNEMLQRGFKPDKQKYRTDFNKHPKFYNDWNPVSEDIMVSKQRIDERVAMKPTWYRLTERVG